MLFILADQESKLEIMKALGEKCGMRSKAKGIVLSLPIEMVMGLGLTEYRKLS